MKSKKLISILLSFAAAAMLPVSVNATETSENFKFPEEYAEATYLDGVVRSIYFTYISSVGAGFSVTDDGKGMCTSSYVLYNDMPAVLTTTLMRSSNGTSWTAVSSCTWTNSYDTWYPPVFRNITEDKLTSGYYYCTYSQVTVYDDNGKSLETGSCFSSGKYV